MTVKKLVNLFNARELMYQKGTGKIVELVPTFVEAAETSIDVQPNESVVWREAHLSEHGIMSIVGIVTYDIGETLMSELGETVTVTEENQDTFIRVVRVGAPLDLIMEGTVDEIADFLDEASQQHQENQIAAANIVDAMQGVLDADTEGVESIEMYTDDEEFDIETLSDEQVDSMIMNEDTGKGKVH